MGDVSTFRLYLLRAAYLLLVVGLAIMIWPRLLAPPADLEHMRGVTWSLLAAVSLLALVGLRHPLRMLPLLLFELTWKAIWLLAIGLPAWSAGRLTPDMRETVFDCVFGVVLVVLVVPWGHVVGAWVRHPGDRWRRRAIAAGDQPV
jgi:hypothetical protein